jgi:hypothetical protein
MKIDLNSLNFSTATSMLAVTKLEGASCNFGLQCQWIGTNHVCVEAKKQGEVCNSTAVCLPGTYCDHFTWTCVPYFSRKMGEHCSNALACEIGTLHTVENSFK